MEIRHIEKRKLHALTAAIYEDDFEQVKDLINTDPDLLTKADANGLNPLLAASLTGRNEIVECLLNKGVDPNFGEHIIFSENKAETDESELANTASRRSEFTYNSLRMAISENHLDTVHILLKHQANLDLLDAQEQTDLLEMACTNKKKNLVADLLTSGINPNVEVNEKGDTPLFIAIKNDDVPTTQLFIHHGAEINWKNHQNETPVYYARSAECAKILLNHGAKLDFNETKRTTAFDKALENKNFAVASEMLRFKHNHFMNQLKEYCSYHSRRWHGWASLPVKWWLPTQAIVFASLQDEENQSTETIVSNIKNTLDQKNLNLDDKLKAILTEGERIIAASEQYHHEQEKPKLNGFKTLSSSSFTSSTSEQKSMMQSE